MDINEERRFFMLSNVGMNGTVKQAQDNELNKQRELRAKGQYVVPRGMTLSQLAKRFNMSVDDFKKMTGLKSSSLSAGQVLNGMPTATVKQGKGLTSIAREAGMSLKDFCELNGISKNYQPKAGEAFYVYPKKDAKPATKQTAKPAAKPAAATSTKTASSTASKSSAKPAATVAKTKVENRQNTANSKLADSLKTPSDIAEALKSSSKLTAAVGKDKFNVPFGKINKNNVVDVIKKYNEISPNESLIDMISSEWGSSKESRKNAITKLYDTLAQNVGSKIATPEKRAAFMKEMEDQYNSWGFVSTKNMDKMINELISAKENAKTSAANGSSSSLSVSLSGNKSKVKLTNGKETTSEQLKKDADVAAARDKRPVKRPEPILDPNGNIVAGVEIHNATAQGPLSGKTIIVNAGHGGYNPKTGIFDPGTDAKDANGKVIEEWYKNKNFTDEIIPQLTSKGAKVIFMNGSAAAVMKAKEKYKNADMFISIHCDSAPSNTSKRGQTVIYRDAGDKKLADAVEAKVETHDWLSKDDFKAKEDVRNLGVLRAVGNMPSILIETGYQSNAKDLANIDSSKFRKEFAELLAQGVVDYVTNK